MKARIITSLFLMFVLFTSGSLLALITFESATEAYGHAVQLHQIEDLRRQLLAQILRIQTDLIAFATPYQSNLTGTVSAVMEVNDIAAKCGSCHHDPAVTVQLADLQRDIAGYENGLSFYITASANRERTDQLKQDAAMMGNAVLSKTEAMSRVATANLSAVTDTAMSEARQGRILLAATFFLTCVAGVFVAAHLMRAITGPVNEIVRATREVAGGKLGYTIMQSYRAEFGELARAFNAMSLSLKSDQDSLLREIAERNKAEAALRESKERYALAERGANDGLWDWDFNGDRIYFSPRWKSMLGYAESAIGSGPDDWFGLVHPDDLPQLQGRLSAHITGDTEHFSAEHRMRHADGTYRWVLTKGIAVRNAAGKAYRMAGSQTDVTDRKLAEEQLLHDAFHDVLTGLPNRALFVNRLQHAFNAARRQDNHSFAVLFLDLDRFKFVNDSYGHAVGDGLLCHVAARLSESLRPGDTVARFGGDEFAILVDRVKDTSEAELIAGRALEGLRQPFQIEEQELVASASVGIAMASSRYDQPDQLLRDADLALYQAKANGKDRYEVFDAFMRSRTLEQMHLEADLRGALERRELHVFYQPIFSLPATSITGFEALLRWRHPERGLISPEQFIPIAEECGLIGRIGEWVLREACRKLREYAKTSALGHVVTMNVNVSGRQLTPMLVEQVKAALAETGVEPQDLRLEITESVIMSDAELAKSIIEELKGLGVGIHIDDFGIGYSSLSYLHRFSVDALKIDRSFVGTAATSRENFEIMKAIMALAEILELEVIAEGVETREQFRMLRELGCRYVQGFLIGRPTEMDVLDTRCSFVLSGEAAAQSGGSVDPALANA